MKSKALETWMKLPPAAREYVLATLEYAAVEQKREALSIGLRTNVMMGSVATAMGAMDDGADPTLLEGMGAGMQAVMHMSAVPEATALRAGIDLLAELTEWAEEQGAPSGG